DVFPPNSPQIADVTERAIRDDCDVRDIRHMHCYALGTSACAHRIASCTQLKESRSMKSQAVLLVGVSAVALLTTSFAHSARAEPAPNYIGKRVPDFLLPETNGQS